MAIHLTLHEDDERELTRLRRELIGWRHVSRLTQRQVATKAGRSQKWISDLELGKVHPHMSSLHEWAAVFDLRVEPVLSGLPGWGEPDPHGTHPFDTVPTQHLVNWQFCLKMSRRFEAADWITSWLMAELVMQRIASGISATQMSATFQLSPSAVSAWERDCNRPLVSKFFVYVRELGGTLKFKLIERKDWQG